MLASKNLYLITEITKKISLTTFIFDHWDFPKNVSKMKFPVDSIFSFLYKHVKEMNGVHEKFKKKFKNKR